MPSLLDDPNQLRHRAQEMRDLASRMALESARAEFLKMAKDYEQMARRAEQRIGDAKGP
jgi:hypothetical protein